MTRTSVSLTDDELDDVDSMVEKITGKAPAQGRGSGRSELIRLGVRIALALNPETLNSMLNGGDGPEKTQVMLCSPMLVKMVKPLYPREFDVVGSLNEYMEEDI